MTPAVEPSREARRVGRFDWERALRAANLPWMTKSLLLLVATYMNADGSNAAPSVAALREATGLHRSTVLEHLSLARNAGYLASLERPGRRTTRLATLPYPSARADGSTAAPRSAHADQGGPPARTAPVRPGGPDQTKTRPVTTTTTDRPLMNLLDGAPVQDEEEENVNLTQDALQERDDLAELWAAFRRATPMGDDHLPSSARRSQLKHLAVLRARGWTAELLEQAPQLRGSMAGAASVRAVAYRRLGELVDDGRRPTLKEASTSVPPRPWCGQCDSAVVRQVEDASGRWSHCPRCSRGATSLRKPARAAS